MMYVAKPVVCWIFILSCWQGTEETTEIMQMKKAYASISLTNRIRVALTGETLDINLFLKIPANYTNQKIECYHHEQRVWEKMIESSSFLSDKQVVVTIKMHNTSSSGDYSCRYANQKVHWVILVRDKGYEEPGDVLEIDVIIQMIFSGALLIFNVVGSLYILKRYKEQPPSKDKENEATEQRPRKSEDCAMDEDAASASLYTALQPRPSSIYDSLNTEVMTHTEDEKNCEQKIGLFNSKTQDEEVFDSVYENL